ncbi:peptidyl-tRNA hydrolase mitochondrial-like, partial [Trifolium pratense]
AGPLAAYYKLPLNQVLVFHDDMNLPCGVLRLQDKGGHGSHKGFPIIHSVLLNCRHNSMADFGTGIIELPLKHGYGTAASYTSFFSYVHHIFLSPSFSVHPFYLQ